MIVDRKYALMEWPTQSWVRAVATLIGLALLTSDGGAQQVPACLEATPEKARALALARRQSSDCPVQCRGCGCKGGPGYRSRRTLHCVGYADLVRECGPAPHDAGCDRECVPVAAGCRRPNAAEVGAAAKALHGTRRPCASGFRYATGGRCVAKHKVGAVCGEPPGAACIRDTAQPDTPGAPAARDANERDRAPSPAGEGKPPSDEPTDGAAEGPPGADAPGDDTAGPGDAPATR